MARKPAPIIQVRCLDCSMERLWSLVLNRSFDCRPELEGNGDSELEQEASVGSDRETPWKERLAQSTSAETFFLSCSSEH